MNIKSIQEKFNQRSIFHSETQLADQQTIIGYEKKFKWSWMATQLNTFVVVTDFVDHPVTIPIIEKHLEESFKFAKKNYTGWPRGLQSALGVISILISSQVDPTAAEYCIKLKSGKKWAGFTIPVIFNSQNQETYQFAHNPMWGAIYYPYFRKLINNLK